jgi:hypothetical protein
MLTVSENVRLAGETGSDRPMVKTAPLTHTGRFACQRAPTVGLRTSGNSYPQSYVGLHTMSLTATVRPGWRILFGSHRCRRVSWHGASVW